MLATPFFMSPIFCIFVRYLDSKPRSFFALYRVYRYRIEHSIRETRPADMKSIKSGNTLGLVYTKHTANKCVFDLIYDCNKEQTH